MNRRTALPMLLAAAALAVGGTGTAVAGHAAFSDSAGAHEAGIHWLSETGITGGCGSGRFCTEDAVKRGQMATFLHRLSGKGTVPPVVNADKVDGLDAEQLRGAAGPAGPAGATGPAGPAGPTGPAGPAAPVPFSVDRVLGQYVVPLTVAAGTGSETTLHSETVQVPSTGFYRLSGRAVAQQIGDGGCAATTFPAEGDLRLQLPDGTHYEQRGTGLVDFYEGGGAKSRTQSRTVWLTAGPLPVSLVWRAEVCPDARAEGVVQLRDISLRLVQD